jgi:hypothetical protein
MIFLIEYNRREGRIVTLKKFKDAERARAQKARLDLELSLNRRQLDREVVLLEATTEKALRRTHRRYFENARQLIQTATGS